MRIIQVILVFAISIFIISCNENEIDNGKISFNAEFLKQTQWKGVLEESFIADGQKVSQSYNVGILFYSEKKGKSSVDTYESSFDYSIDNKLLTITNGDSDMNGKWLVLQFDGTKMTLEEGTGGQEAYKGILTLTRSY
ncbi:MAG: hypothetical protein RR331_08585 [Bacteroides sp.]